MRSACCIARASSTKYRGYVGLGFFHSARLSLLLFTARQLAERGMGPGIEKMEVDVWHSGVFSSALRGGCENNLLKASYLSL